MQSYGSYGGSIMTDRERAEQDEFIRQIFKEARHLRKTGCPTHSDYIHYEKLLHSRGIFGYEQELSDELRA